MASAAVLAVVCAVATAFMMTTPAAAQSRPDLIQCQTMAGNVSKCVLKLGDPLNPTPSTAPTTPACCSLIKDAASDQLDCLCGVYIGLKNYTSTAASPFDSSVKDCGITTDFASACAKVEKQLQDGGYINKPAGSGKDTGAAGKTGTAGVFGIVLVTALTLFF